MVPDFRETPKKSTYRFENDVCKENTEGSFLEVPITSFHRPLFLVITDRILGFLFYYFQPFSDGTHNRKMDELEQVKNKPFDKIKKSYKLMLTLSTQGAFTLLYAVVCSRKCEVICCIDHPKDFSKSAFRGIKVLSHVCESTTYSYLINKYKL